MTEPVVPVLLAAQLLGHLLQVAKKVAKQEQLEEGYRLGEAG